MENKNEMIIFIVSNGRPNGIITLKALLAAGSTMKYYIVVDSLDKTVPEYKKVHGDKVIVFDKEAIAKTTDNGDNFWNLKTPMHARNACFDIAENLGYKYFLMLDDDYTQFLYRIDDKLQFPKPKMHVMRTRLDDVFLSTLEYYKNSNFKAICYSQGGDWFGGIEEFGKAPKRKSMNSWFCSTERRFNYVGRLNEDVNTYMTHGMRGGVFMTIPFIQINQKQTQKVKGGMTEAYLDDGTYVKSFYTVMYCPSFCRIITMGETKKRLHHHISWDKSVPYIVSEKYKKQ